MAHAQAATAAHILRALYIYVNTPGLVAMPQGVYGISYDIYTRPTETDLPDGWFSHRGM